VPDQPCHLVAPPARSSSRAYRLACLARRTFADQTERPDRPHREAALPGQSRQPSPLLPVCSPPA